MFLQNLQIHDSKWLNFARFSMTMKFNRSMLAAVCLTGLSVVLLQCKHEPVHRILTNGTDTSHHITPVPLDTTICFERDILPLFVSNCAKSGCHNATSHREGLRLYTYNGIIAGGIKAGNPSTSRLYANITNGYMNSTAGSSSYGNLTAAQVALIKRWILEGAKNGTNCPNMCDSNSFAFKANIDPLVQKYCIACHTSGNPSGGAAFDSYAGVKASVDKGVFWNRLNATGGSIMPPAGKLSTCQLTQFKKWINAKAPNN